MKFSIFGYGFFPVMISRYKIKHIAEEVNSNKDYYMEDIKGYKFPVDSDYNDNMIIFNSKKICTIFDLDKILNSGVNNIIIDCRFLNNKNFLKVVKNYKESINLLSNKGIQKYKNFTSYLQDDYLFKNYSRGHLLRGVK